MKPRFRSLIAAYAPLSRSSLIVCASLCAATSASAADLQKANNTDALNAASSWVENVVPGGTDNLIWNSTRTAAGLYSFGNNQFTGGGTIQNPGGLVQLRVASNGTATLINNAFIDMSAATVDVELTGGTLRVNNTNYSPTVTVASGRTLTVGGNGINNNGNTKTFTMAGAGNIIFNANSGGGGAMNFNINGPTVNMNNAASGWTFGTVTSGKLVLGTGTVLNGKSLYMNSANGLEFGTDVTAVSLGGLGGSGDILLANVDTTAVDLTIGSNNVNLSYTGVLSGDGSVKKIGTGTQTFTAANSYLGNTSIEGGQVNLDSTTTALGSGTVTLTNEATLRMYRGEANDNVTSGVFANTLHIPSGQSGTVFNMPRGTWSGALTGDGTLNLRVNATRGDFTGNWSAFAGQINVSARSGNDDFRIALGGGGNGLQLAAGKLNLAAGVNLYQSVNPPSGEGTQTVHHIGELSGSTGAAIRGNPVLGRFANWTVGALETVSLYEGTINDSAGASRLTKVGSGTLTLSGINGYSGATTVSAGTLALSGDGGIDNSASVTIAAGAELDTTAKTGTYTLAGTQPFAFGLDAAGAGSSGKINAASLDITDADISFDIVGTLDGSQYVLASYTSLTGTEFFSVTVPDGYTLDYGTGNNSQIKLISAAGASGYSTWTSLNGASSDPAADHDNDGVSNGVEYFIGGPNGNTTGFTALPGVSTVDGVRSVTWTYGSGYTDTYGSGFTVQSSTTLATGSWTTETLGGNVSISGSNVTYTFPAGPVKNFVRLVVTP